MVESGSHADLLGQAGLYADMWARQANEQREDVRASAAEAAE